MATGASTADLAVILIDARKGVLTQTRRHSFIVSLLGIRNIVVAVNKMDLVDYAEDAFRGDRSRLSRFRRKLRPDRHHCIPVSALAGDNVTLTASACLGITGRHLLGHLETVPIGGDDSNGPLRMAVQWVNRPNQAFRGFAGTIASGIAATGDADQAYCPRGAPRALPASSRFDGDLDEAIAGQSITITLDDEIDVARGDVICTADQPAAVADQFETHVLWMGDEPMLPDRPYLIKIGSCRCRARSTQPKYKINVNTLEHVAAKTLELNEIGVCNLELDRHIRFCTL